MYGKNNSGIAEGGSGGFGKLTLREDNSLPLKGTTLDIYRLILISHKPLGIREIQRHLNLSSPSVVQYHLEKMVQAGLLRREKGNYVLNKVLLENYVKISRFLIPRFLFFTVFGSSLLIIQIIITLELMDPIHEHFSTVAIAILVLILGYETIRVKLKRRV